MTRDIKSTRRRFLRTAGAVALATAGVTRAIAEAQGKKPAPTAASPGEGASGAGGDLPLIDEKAALAVTLKYKHDAAAVPAAVKVAKSGVDGAKQNCANCMFYAKAGKAGGDEAGKCQLFPQGNVKAKGWCISWAKKA